MDKILSLILLLSISLTVNSCTSKILKIDKSKILIKREYVNDKTTIPHYLQKVYYDGKLICESEPYLGIDLYSAHVSEKCVTFNRKYLGTKFDEQECRRYSMKIAWNTYLKSIDKDSTFDDLEELSCLNEFLNQKNVRKSDLTEESVIFLVQKFMLNYRLKYLSDNHVDSMISLYRKRLFTQVYDRKNDSCLYQLSRIQQNMSVLNNIKNHIFRDEAIYFYVPLSGGSNIPPEEDNRNELFFQCVISERDKKVHIRLNFLNSWAIS